MLHTIAIETFPSPLLTKLFHFDLHIEHEDRLQTFIDFLSKFGPAPILKATLTNGHLIYSAFSDRAAFLHKRKGVIIHQSDGDIVLDAKTYRLKTPTKLRIYPESEIDCKWIRKHVDIKRSKKQN